MYLTSVQFLSHPRSEGWPHHECTFSIYLCPLSFSLTLSRIVLSTYWCCPSRPCMVFLAGGNLALFLALSLSPTPLFAHGETIVCWLPCFTSASLYSSFVKNSLICLLCCLWILQNLSQPSLPMFFFGASSFHSQWNKRKSFWILMMQERWGGSGVS